MIVPNDRDLWNLKEIEYFFKSKLKLIKHDLCV